jgi:hypothetical protein
MYLSVNNVTALNDYKLELTFENGEIKIFDVKPYLDTGVFTTLRDKTFFKRVKVSFDTIEWPDGIDLDPEVLYEKSVNQYNGVGDFTTDRHNGPDAPFTERMRHIEIAQGTA